ncbi:hypothetical protein ACFL5U_01080 [Candidatus Margulisiibacteriota bacterium]
MGLRMMIGPGGKLAKKGVAGATRSVAGEMRKGLRGAYDVGQAMVLWQQAGRWCQRTKRFSPARIADLIALEHKGLYLDTSRPYRTRVFGKGNARLIIYILARHSSREKIVDALQASHPEKLRAILSDVAWFVRREDIPGLGAINSAASKAQGRFS